MFPAWLVGSLLFLPSPMLRIEQVQAVHGLLGPIRKSETYYPHDQALFRFLLTGAKTDAQGKFEGEMTIAIRDPQGKTLDQTTRKISGILTFGAGTMPGSAFINIPPELTPGDYKIGVAIRDTLSEQSVSFQRTIKILPPEFAIIHIQSFYDAQNLVPAPFGGTVGQWLYFSLRVIGYDQKKINVTMEMQLLDKEGKELLPMPIKANLKEDDPEVIKKVTFLQFRTDMALTRPGEFVARIVVRDHVANKEARFEAPLTIRMP